MKKILYYTCFHQRQEREFWDEVRAGLARQEIGLRVAGTEHAVCVPDPDMILRQWSLPSLRAPAEPLASLLDWDDLRRNAAGYGEEFSRTAILDQAASYVLQLAAESPDWFAAAGSASVRLAAVPALVCSNPTPASP